MDVEKVFVSINARDWDGLSRWYQHLLDRPWDRQPAPDCHEWDVATSVLFQVLDNGKRAGDATVTLHITDLDAEVARLRQAGIDLPDPTKVEGFETLRYCEFRDPEGNRVGLTEGA